MLPSRKSIPIFHAQTGGAQSGKMKTKSVSDFFELNAAREKFSNRQVLTPPDLRSTLKLAVRKLNGLVFKPSQE